MLVAVFALAILLPAAWWGLPSATSELTVHGWDVDGVGGLEVLAEIHNFIRQPKADWYVAYPPLHYFLLALLYAPYLLFLAATGGLGAPSPAYPYGFSDPVTAFLVLGVIAHALTLAMGIGTAVVCYRLAHRLGGRMAGGVAAAALTFSVPFAFYSRTGNLDVPVLFWTALALLVTVRAVNDGLTVALALKIGVTSALAAATKDQAIPALVPALLLMFLLLIHPRSEDHRIPWRATIWLVAAGIVTYVLAVGLPLRPQRFVRHLDYIFNFDSTFTNLRVANTLTQLRPPTLAGHWQLLGDAARAMIAAIGIPALIAGLIGLGFPAGGRRGRSVLVAALLGFCVLAIGTIHHMQYRYTLLPSFVLAIGLGVLVAYLWHSSSIGRVAAVILGIVALAPPVAGTVDLTWQMMVDARYEAGRWLSERAQPGDVVGFYGRPHQLPAIPAGVRLENLDTDPHAESRLEGGEIDFMIVAADYFAVPDRSRSVMLPDSTWNRLLDGTLGLHLAHTSSSAPLTGSPPAYLPYVNPDVRIFTSKP